jgi:hypothetical protein
MQPPDLANIIEMSVPSIMVKLQRSNIALRNLVASVCFPKSQSPKSGNMAISEPPIVLGRATSRFSRAALAQYGRVRLSGKTSSLSAPIEVTFSCPGPKSSYFDSTP